MRNKTYPNKPEEPASKSLTNYHKLLLKNRLSRGLGFGVWGLGFGVWEIGRAHV